MQIAPLFLAFCLASLTACSEARSDIENLEPTVLEEEARALTESAQGDVAEQVQQIQPMATNAGELGDGVVKKIK